MGSESKPGTSIGGPCVSGFPLTPPEEFLRRRSNLRTSSEVNCQAEEGGLSSMAGPAVKQLTGTGRPDGMLQIAKAKTWVWEEFGEALEKDFQLASRKF